MRQAFQTIATSALAGLARLLTPAISRQLSRLSTRLVSDVPRLASTWAVRFDDPTRIGGLRPTGIDATLQQFGRIVRGIGHVQGEPGDPFIYRGIIKRNAFYGSFRRVDSHVLAGTGTFVLKISSNSRQMTGQCTWYNSQLDDVWTSSYAWTRKERSSDLHR